MQQKQQLQTKLLVISGLDTSGGAGIFVDREVCLKNSTNAIFLSSGLFFQDGFLNKSDIVLHDLNQLFSVLRYSLNNYDVFVCKIGAVGSVENINMLSCVFDEFKTKNIKIVLDTPLISSSGLKLFMDNDRFFEAFVVFAQKYSFLLTPNQFEFNLLGGHNLVQSCKNVLLKSAVCDENAGFVKDFLFCDGLNVAEFVNKYDINHQKKRGTGCSLATQIACNLSHNMNLLEAVDLCYK